jgi:hypothetical protein
VGCLMLLWGFCGIFGISMGTGTCDVALEICGMFGVALKILLDVWYSYGDSVGCWAFLWRLRYLVCYWWCYGNSVGCLMSLWGFLERLKFSWRFCGMFDVTMEILTDIWCCRGDSSEYLKLPWGIQ